MLEYNEPAANGHPYGGSVALMWLNAVPDLVIALGCFVAPFVLAYVVRHRRDLKLDWLVVGFGFGIVAAGVMHLLSAWNVWHASYWPQTIAKLIAAASLVPTALLLCRHLPEILSLSSHRQLRRANESLARANQELEAFTASVSHDLRSPLTTIAGQAGLLELSLGPNLTDDQRKRLQRIHGGVKHMSELIDALRVLSRISRQALNRELVDITALAEGAVDDLRQKHPERRIEIEIQPGMLVQGDRRLMADLVTNLVSNAWKFTANAPNARIELGQEPQGSMTTLHIRDNGTGFDMQHANKLFKPFQRLHGAEFEGSGLGLATVARIVNRHGGRIWAHSAPQEGAIFYFTLPTSPTTDEILVEAQPAATQPTH